MKVYIATGHGIRSDGRFDPGASGSGTNEQAAGDIVVRAAADTLRSWGVDVKDEAYQDDPNYSGTDDLVRAWGADILVSVHHDWIKAAPGFFTLWYRENGRLLGKVIEQHVAQAGFALRSYPLDGYRSDLSILKTVGGIPNTLVECGRIGQYTPAELQAMGRAIAAGVAAFLGVATEAPAEEEDDMNDADRKLLRQGRLSDIGRSYDIDRIIAAIRGDWAEADRLKAVRDEAVRAERARLGL